jgi:hypothetical protein
MKLIVRALVLGVFVAGASAAVVSSHAGVAATSSHQVVVAELPIPTCPPGNPTGCGTLPPQK